MGASTSLVQRRQSLGRRRTGDCLVGGPEDMIVDISLDLVATRTAI